MKWADRFIKTSNLVQSRNRAGGFTVVELTIATAVFATVLIVGLSSFIGIGKVYYKSVSLTQTQSAAQQIISQLSGDIQFAPTVASRAITCPILAKVQLSKEVYKGL